MKNRIFCSVACILTLLITLSIFVFPHSAKASDGISVYVDIKPGSCPNPLNVKSGGELTVAILGTDEYDVTEIVSVELGGVTPHRLFIEDVATPFNGASKDDFWDCTEVGPDGWDDAVLKFDTQEVVEALGDVEDGQYMELTLTGRLANGTPFEGTDVVLIIKK